MDALDLSRRMQRLGLWLDENCQSARVERHRVGDGFLTIDPKRQGETASANFNRVYLCGREQGIDAGSVAHWIDLFSAQDVKTFFVWLSPGPDMEEVRGFIEAGGLSRVPHVRYPTLLRDREAQVPFRTDLDSREVTPPEILAAREALGEALWPGYLRSAGKDGFFHYMAFDGSWPVATAALAVRDGMAYLLSAATREADSGRGAQQALIAARVARAEQLGCAIQASETLSILEHSLRNLQRAGFREVYEKELFAWAG